jgi:hypothetical protein
VRRTSRTRIFVGRGFSRDINRREAAALSR